MSNSVCYGLKSWSLPDPPEDDRGRFLTACYENLIGAGYAVLMTAREGYHRRNDGSPDVAGLSDCLASMAKGSSISTRCVRNWNQWLNGFYFNSATHRTVWVCERLFAIFAWLPESAPFTVPPAKTGPFLQLLEDADDRLQDFTARLGFSKLDGIVAAIRSFDAYRDLPLGLKVRDLRDIAVSRTNILLVLYLRVNVQKHAILGLADANQFAKARSQRSAEPGWWEDVTVTAEDRWNFLFGAFEMVAEAYRDVWKLVDRKLLLLPR